MGLLAVVELSFEPSIRLGDLLIRWQTAGVTVAVLCGLVLAVILVGDRRRRASNAIGLGIDDLIYIVLAIVPGAVVGGRIMHGLVFWEAYLADPVRLFDVSVGSLSLTGAVLGGTVSAGYIARLIGAPVRHWADIAAIPLLLTLGIGKFAQLLGGSGQGAAFDGPWAVAFTGAGAWVSPNPSVPAHPSQVYEGLWMLLGIPVLVGWVVVRSLLLSGRRGGGLRRRLQVQQGTGRLFAFMLGWFLLGRVVVGFTWRDDALVGPLNIEQAVALAMGIGVGAGLFARGRSNVDLDTTLTPMERRP